MRTKFILITVVCFFAQFNFCIWENYLRADSGQKTAVQQTVENFALLDHNGQFQELFYYSDQKAIVLISQVNGCPIIRKTVPYLRELKEAYQSRGVEFLMVNSNPQDDRSSIVEEARQYEMNFPILEDKSQIVADMLNLTRTAEAVVINPSDWTVVYRGAVHDQFDYETQKSKIKHHYLRDALESFLRGKTVKVSQTSVKGCLINKEYYKKEYSYASDVAPILVNNCVVCHSPGGVAPWSMDHYEKVKSWGPMIKEVVQTKRMPPWHADPAYGSFKNDLSLNPEEVRAIINWVKSGYAKGEGEDLLQTTPPPQHAEWALGEPDLIFTLKEKQDINAIGVDELRLLEADKPVEQDLWVRAIDSKPGNRQAVHHIFFLADYVGENGDPAISEKEEWFRRSGEDMEKNMEIGQLVGGYAPGMGIVAPPEETGFFIPKGARFYFRMHYYSTGKPEQDLSKAGLYLYREKPKFILSVDDIVNRSLNIPPGQKDYKVTETYVFKHDVILTAIQPHMHFRGKSMKLTIQYPDGKSEIALSVPNYKFRWQRQYIFKEPKKLPKGTGIIAEGVYDNSAQNPDNPDPAQQVYYGAQSGQEMFMGILYFIITD